MNRLPLVLLAAGCGTPVAWLAWPAAVDLPERVAAATRSYRVAPGDESTTAARAAAAARPAPLTRAPLGAAARPLANDLAVRVVDPMQRPVAGLPRHLFCPILATCSNCGDQGWSSPVLARSRKSLQSCSPRLLPRRVIHASSDAVHEPQEVPEIFTAVEFRQPTLNSSHQRGMAVDSSSDLGQQFQSTTRITTPH